MSDSDRSIALTTACDDLQAQLEAGDRSVRHIDDDLTLLREALHTAVTQVSTLTDLQRHIADLRANMAEQRTALREVRRAATKLCATVSQAREQMETLADETQVLEPTNEALRSEHARRLNRLPDPIDDKADAGQRYDSLADEQRFRTGLPTTATSDHDPTA
jgi:predicted nuclease with TOPRIM domain